MKKYKIHIAESAKKALSKIPKKDREKIEETISFLEVNPRPFGHIKLKSSSKTSLYRIRYGDYRVVYSIKDEVLLILVLEIGNRKEIYR